MSHVPANEGCPEREQVAAHALRALPPAEAAALEAHLAACEPCRRESERLAALVTGFDAWPTDVLRPRASLQSRLAQRVADAAGVAAAPLPPPQWSEPEWQEVAPGIFCKLLANDVARGLVSMLVRLLPNVHYPPHTHAGVEELHLLDGELWIDDRKLRPGDFNRGEPHTSDARVWSETGCTCVLITSTRDVLR